MANTVDDTRNALKQDRYTMYISIDLSKIAPILTDPRKQGRKTTVLKKEML